MKRISFVILALAAIFVFACKQENYASNDTSVTETAASTETTGVTATNTPMASSTATTLSSTDQDFINKAAEGGLMEVTLGQLAAAKATNSDVRDFGNRMVSDHGTANDELTQLAADKGITLPTQPGAPAQKASNELSSKMGKAFDKAYMSNMVKDHEKDVADFKKAANEVQDPDLKAWVTKTLPTLEEHLRQAKLVAAKVKG